MTINLLLPKGLLLFLLLLNTTTTPALASDDSFQEIKILNRDKADLAKTVLVIKKVGQATKLLPATPVARLLGVPTDEATLVNTTDMSQFSPPSPDPAGIAYLSHLDSLLISDSEVNEIPILFTGDNLFLTSLSGDLLDTLTTIHFANEPSGVAYNPANNHLFFTDDTGKRGFFEMDPGPDGAYDTPDDIITYIDSTEFGSMDPEGIAFDSWQGHLFIVDGLNEEVYEIDPGPNGIFDGVMPAGDDLVSHFDVTSLGINDPEGIEFNPDDGHLYILASSGHVIAETETDGTLIRYIDIASLNAVNPAGLAYAPASSDPTMNHLYIVARGIDNGVDPDENDGMLYEISLPPNNMPPRVEAGPNQIVIFPQSALLDGAASDDGLPDPPGILTTTWTQLIGPGTATFDDANAVNTTVMFSMPGTYFLRLTADDGALTAISTIQITVKPALFLPLVRW